MLPLCKIFTVTKNETDLVEDFIIFHGKLIGYENIVIIDNCSTCPKVLETYQKYKQYGMSVVTEPNYSGGGQGKSFTKHMNLHKKKCSFLIGLDTDEFINMKKMPFLKTLSVLSRTKYTKFRVCKYLSSVPDNQKTPRPATDITTFIVEKASPPKYFFKSSTFISTVNGCHNGKTKPDLTYDVDIEYFHFHNTGARRSIERSKTIISGYNYADVDSPLVVQLKSLISVKSNVGSHRVLEYALFLSKSLCLGDMVNNNMWPETPQCLNEIAESFPTIYGWKYSHVKMLRARPREWQSMFDSTLFYDPLPPLNTVTSTYVRDSIIKNYCTL